MGVAPRRDPSLAAADLGRISHRGGMLGGTKTQIARIAKQQAGVEGRSTGKAAAFYANWTLTRSGGAYSWVEGGDEYGCTYTAGNGIKPALGSIYQVTVQAALASHSLPPLSPGYCGAWDGTSYGAGCAIFARPGLAFTGYAPMAASAARPIYAVNEGDVFDDEGDFVLAISISGTDLAAWKVQ